MKMNYYYLIFIKSNKAQQKGLVRGSPIPKKEGQANGPHAMGLSSDKLLLQIVQANRWSQTTLATSATGASAGQYVDMKSSPCCELQNVSGLHL